jgi:hypothetical protein
MDVTYKIVCVTHFSIIYQLAIMRPYVEKHLYELCEKT